MTNDDLQAQTTVKQLAEQLVANFYQPDFYGPIVRTVAQAYLSLLAQAAARGKVVEACPYCVCAKPGQLVRPSTGSVLGWLCRRCGANFDKPAYYQRIEKPEAE